MTNDRMRDAWVRGMYRRLHYLVGGLGVGMTGALLSANGGALSSSVLGLLGLLMGMYANHFEDRLERKRRHVPERHSWRIVRPPLSRLAAIAELFWSKRTRDRVFNPLVADVREEWVAAHADGKQSQAWWIKWVRGPWTMVTNMALQTPVSLTKRLIELVKSQLG